MARTAKSSRPLSVCALVPYPLGTTPSQRFRLEQWAGGLAQRGIRLEFRPFATPRLMRLLHTRGHGVAKLAAGAWCFLTAAARAARNARFDAIVVHRCVSIFGPALLERLIGALGPTVFDFDDAIYLLHTSPANRRIGWLKFPGKTATLCRISKHVVVANRGLAEYAARYNRKVSVVPSSVDTEHYRPLSGRREAGPLRVGWTGSSTSLAYLEMFSPVLKVLLERLPIELVVHSDRRPDLQALPFDWRRWSAETEIVELGRLDVGIMPMPDDPWARGKSSMKALLYMAMGIPAVCSAVGTNLDVIRHRENGLLANDLESWVEGIGALVEDGALRRRLGEAGRGSVEERYSARVCAGQFAEVVREVAG